MTDPDKPSRELVRELMRAFFDDQRATTVAVADLIEKAYSQGWHQGWKDAPSDED